MKEKKDTKPITIRLTPQEHYELKLLAVQLGVSNSDLVRLMLKETKEKLEK